MIREMKKRNLDSKSSVGEVEIGLLKLLVHPRGFKPLTFGLEMRGFVVTNSTELSRFVTLQ